MRARFGFLPVLVQALSVFIVATAVVTGNPSVLMIGLGLVIVIVLAGRVRTLVKPARRRTPENQQD